MAHHTSFLLPFLYPLPLHVGKNVSSLKRFALLLPGTLTVVPACELPCILSCHYARPYDLPGALAMPGHVICMLSSASCSWLCAPVMEYRLPVWPYSPALLKVTCSKYSSWDGKDRHFLTQQEHSWNMFHTNSGR